MFLRYCHRLEKQNYCLPLYVSLSLKQRRMLSFHMSDGFRMGLSDYLSESQNESSPGKWKQKICLCLYLSLCLYLCLSLCISVSLCLYLCVSVSMSLCLYLCLCVFMSLSLCVSVYMSLCLSLSVSVCLCLSVRLSQRMCGAHSPVGMLADGTSLIVIAAC